VGQILHGCATATEAVRRAIQNSQESLRAFAKRYGINPEDCRGRLSDTQRGDNMKFASAAALAVIGCLVGFNSANAQGAAMKTTRSRNARKAAFG